MKTLHQFVSGAMGMIAWIVVGLAMSQFVSTKAATIIGFIAFWVVVVLLYPSQQNGNGRRH